MRRHHARGRKERRFTREHTLGAMCIYIYIYITIMISSSKGFWLADDQENWKVELCT